MTQAYPPAHPPPPEPPTGYVPDVPWRRLDPRMLLVHPVVELVKFLPVLVGIFVLGSNGNQGWWQLFGVAIPIGLGIMRFLTTTFRITPTQIELQRGLIGRKVLTARLDRVRAVELTSTPMHRILGLAKVEVGTASGAKQDDDKFALDGLPLDEARHLRVALLHRVDVAAGPDASSESLPRGHDSYDASPVAPVEDEQLLTFDPGWVRYAPLTSSGSVIAAGVIAALGQFSDQIGSRLFNDPEVRHTVEHLSLAAAIPLALAAFLVLGAVFSVLGYLVTNWGFSLARDSRGRTFHVRRGLLTSTETSLERERVRGLSVDEPIGLRLAHAGRLYAIVTGVSKKEAGRTQLVPPAPRAVIDETGIRVLEQPEPLTLPLVQHGPAARRRRWTRALLGAVVLPVVAVVLVLTTPVPGWVVLPALVALPVGAALAVDRYRRLGHGLTDQHLVVRSGSLAGRRDIVQRTGIIGWNLQQSWFQRRAGLVTLVATTAAGTQAYAAIDVPEPLAIALAHDAVPGLVEPFLA
ncbi:PH domain-containing protein [Marmoricola sp. URHB0036]|uniref:PH domain-containing protein n=1 Tax=Marmoricola sp. URHB0036 TaxID=1298863 RepID=UPI000416330E|nr:PH domain-containing protein [Marmoricola sp. URHB0036]